MVVLGVIMLYDVRTYIIIMAPLRLKMSSAPPSVQAQLTVDQLRNQAAIERMKVSDASRRYDVCACCEYSAY